MDSIDSVADTLMKHSDKHIILVDLPNWYQLTNWSCMNVEVRKTNKCLTNLCKGFENITLVGASNAQKELHTRHGLHFNRKEIYGWPNDM